MMLIIITQIVIISDSANTFDQIKYIGDLIKKIPFLVNTIIYLKKILIRDIVE